MASAGLRAHIGVWGRAPSRDAAVGSQEAKPPEAESSVAFEAPVEEPNLTLVVDSFLLRNALCKARFCYRMSSVSPSVCPSVTLVNHDHIG